MIDRTHAIEAQSWVTSANGHTQFPVQNLPLGVFTNKSSPPCVGVAIGDSILNVAAALDAGLFEGEAKEAAELCVEGSLNRLMAKPPSYRRALRLAVFDLLESGSPKKDKMRDPALGIVLESASCTVSLPARVGGFTDFFAGIHHAYVAGKMFRPQTPLTPNYKYVPIAYNSRASTVAAAPKVIRRPKGQIVLEEGRPPELAASNKLDYEFELGVWIGEGNPDGDPIGITRASESIFGYCILNDWSSRDIQRWEAQPLGPFLAKSFATTVSPWIITPEALAPFRSAQTPRPDGDPSPLPYLLDEADQLNGALDLQLEILISTSAMREKGLPAERISGTNALNLYWTPAQLVAHHSSNGCVLEPGDIFGSGTISGLEKNTAGCLLEQTRDGSEPLTLASGETRSYLHDGDEITLRATCSREGFATIGFGDNVGRIAPAK